MLATQEISNAKKTKGIATTYRAGKGHEFKTCPNSCKLKPACKSGTNKVDTSYLKTLLKAVPKKGIAFTYSHFHWDTWFPLYKKIKETNKNVTTINYSADSWIDAVKAVKAGIPTTTQIPESEVVKYRKGKVRAVQCPETNGRVSGCLDCGGGVPLCARADRDYVIVFPAHGSHKKKVGTSEAGGCYTSSGNVAIHYKRYANQEQNETDIEKLKRFVAGLPRGSILRHHITGDIGKDN